VLSRAVRPAGDAGSDVLVERMGKDAASDNPFAASVIGSRTGPPTPAVVWRTFLIQRGLRIFVLPSLLGAISLLLRTDLDLPLWSVSVVTIGAAMIWVPTSLWMAWARFFRPRDDDRALLLTTGEVLDRAAFMHLVAARAVEVVMLIVGLLGLASLFIAQFGWFGAPVMALCLGVAAWSVVMLIGQHQAARAATLVAEGRSDGVLAALRWAWPARLHRRTADTLEVLAAQVLVREGEVEGALERLANVHDPVLSHADLLRAMILLGRGVPPPRALLDDEPHSVPRALSQDHLRALLALQEGDGDRALAALARWEEAARVWLPWRQRNQHHLLAAAAHELAERPDEARRRRALSDRTMDQIAWMEAVYPTWHGLLARIATRNPGPASL